MSKAPISSPLSINNLNHHRHSTASTVPFIVCNSDSTVMWRNIGKQLISCKTSTRKSHSFGFSQDSVISNVFKLRPLTELTSCSNIQFRELGFHEFLPRDEFSVRRGQVDFNLMSPKSYSSVAEAEAVVDSVDVEEESRNVSVSHDYSGNTNLSVSGSDRVGEELIEGKKVDRKQGWMGNYKYMALWKRQVKIETEAWEQAVNEYRELLDDMCRKKLAPNLPFVKSLFLGWFEPLRNKIAEEQELIRAGKNRMGYAKYFDHLPADKMAVIALHKLVGLLMSGGQVRVVSAACTLGEAIEHEVKIHKFLEDTKKKKEKKAGKKSKKEGEEQEEKLHGCNPEQEILHHRVTRLMKKQKLRAVRKIVDKETGLQPWGLEARAKVGCHLIDLIIQTAYIQPPADQSTDNTDVRPAFEHTLKTLVNRGQKSRRAGVIQCDPLVRKGLERSARHMVMPYMPMLVPPVKWTGYDKGAYLYLSSYMMRTHGSRQQREAIKNVSRGQLQQVYEALDTLGHTRWRVNKRVLCIIDKIWASGGCLGGLVDRSDIPLPQQPDTEDEALLKKWKWELQNIRKKNSERHSQRCDTELKLSVARKMEDEEGFFYPHNLDFRGRAYPMHPHLNHLGSDICRGILEFAEGRPLGKSGLHWLKVHLANLFANGVDKLSHEGRVAFVENHLDDIFDSADRPLEGKRWWLNAEDPFECLATCISLSEALRSRSPETTISHIPVHQDGSCNGLQHYAALGRDKVGAISVNLVAGEKPGDVYSGIALRVLDIMRMDAEKDPAVFAEASHARLLVNQVDRKLVKQTVMTSVYGVTYTGARDQISRRLKERGTIADDTELFGAACYAAKVTLTALEQMFEAARKIMSWLGDCAKVIASENQTVRWTTPLGLPVVQPYHKIGEHHVKTSLQVLTLRHESEKVLAKRQKTAFPPNFVHSLDGSHMMMTAIACNKAGLNFAGVHDSYWTHACDVDQMNAILRDKFVELYDQPILENLLEEFEKSFPELAFPPLPDRGDFDLRDVLQSPYFFN